METCWIHNLKSAEWDNSVIIQKREETGLFRRIFCEPLRLPIGEGSVGVVHRSTKRQETVCTLKFGAGILTQVDHWSPSKRNTRETGKLWPLTATSGVSAGHVSSKCPLS